MPAATPEPFTDDAISAPGTTTRTLLIACGALAREIRLVLGQLPPALAKLYDVEYLPANLHNRPERIPARVEELIVANKERYGRIAVAYADCGTGGLLDAVLDRHGVTRLPGAHCYEFFAGAEAFAQLHESELGTFFLTDYLCKHFEPLVMGALGIERHPELRDMYFGNYVRVVLLSQSDDPTLVEAGRSAARRLGLAFEHRHVGMQPFAESVNLLLGVS